jgi:hypothetical protein
MCVLSLASCGREERQDLLNHPIYRSIFVCGHDAASVREFCQHAVPNTKHAKILANDEVVNANPFEQE